MVNFGCDIDRTWTANAQGDFKIVSDIENAEQAVYNRLMTKLGELDRFHYTNYGNGAHDAIGGTNQKLVEARVILDTKKCLLQDPRVEKILSILVSWDRGAATVDASIQLIGEDKPTNLVFTVGDDEL